ncbi:LysR family transcriptional regulator [Nocardioides sp. NPDC051685]|uniref:LysR family transcriptional regulator n=1 Tax=Nocardioides sp. NPDC051685 TaxID=3364334 RepID=UPI0037897185
MSELQKTDLNLLVAFDALMAERNVTRAAERMHVGQPAMSASLARLRKLFNDPLLVREGRALVPTPVAESLVTPVRQALSIVEGALGTRTSFDPAEESRTFTILASDYVLVVMLRELLNTLRKEAPGVRINVRPIGADYVDQLRRGLIDLFIVPRELERSGVRLLSEDLFTDRLVCAVDADNEVVGESMTMHQFESLPYLAFVGDEMTTAAQSQLRAQGVDRPIDVATQSFVVAPLLLRGSSFFSVIHERLGRTLGRQNGLRLLESPVPFTPITEAMFWAVRHADSPAHQWLRDRLREAAAALR